MTLREELIACGSITRPTPRPTTTYHPCTVAHPHGATCYLPMDGWGWFHAAQEILWWNPNATAEGALGRAIEYVRNTYG